MATKKTYESFQGIGEILLFDRPLTDLERYKVEFYMKRKYDTMEGKMHYCVSALTPCEVWEITYNPHSFSALFEMKWKGHTDRAVSYDREDILEDPEFTGRFAFRMPQQHHGGSVLVVDKICVKTFAVYQ